jgi:hypothetical protein
MKKSIVALVGIAAFVSLACKTLIPDKKPVKPTPTEVTPTQVILKPQFIPGEIIEQVDFDKDKDKWTNQMDLPTEKILVDQGALRFSWADHNPLRYSIYNSDKDLSNVQMTVDAISSDGYPLMVGFICRFQNYANYYALEVNENYFGIFKIQNNKWKSLISWHKIYPAIQFGVIKKIKATCVGDKLSLWYENQLLGEVSDRQFSTGKIGLTADAEKGSDYDVSYRNLIIYSPQNNNPSSAPIIPTKVFSIKEKGFPFPAGQLREQEGFDLDNGRFGWVNEGDHGSIKYTNGYLAMNVNDDSYVYTIYQPPINLKNVIMSVDVNVVKPVGIGDYGFICRFKDKKNYYYLGASEDHTFAIERMEDDNITALIAWDYSIYIPKSSSLTIQAACVGNKLSFGINGQLIGEVTDDHFQDGKVGLMIDTPEKSEQLFVYFDNFMVYTPNLNGR